MKRIKLLQLNANSSRRIYALDFIRAIATCLIVLTHYNILFLDGTNNFKTILLFYIGNVDIGRVGVSLFIIISGAALMKVYGSNPGVLLTKQGITTFFKKRFLSIYPMFWIAWIAVFLYDFWTFKGLNFGMSPISLIYIFSIFTQTDAFLQSAGFPTIPIVGEWFIGMIICFYLLFPLILAAVSKFPKITLCVSVALHLLFTSPMFPIFFNIPVQENVFARLTEFVFGMLFIKWLDDKTFKWWVSIPFICLIILDGMLKLTPEQLNPITEAAIVGLSLFVILVALCQFFQISPIKRAVMTISKYSFAIFMTHHILINNVIAIFGISNVNSRTINYILFIFTIIMIAIFARLLFIANSKVVSYLSPKLLPQMH